MTTIITDSACDFTPEQARRMGIDMLPMRVTLDGVEYQDGVTLTGEDFYALLKSARGMPTTSLLSIGEYMDAIARHPEGDAVLLTISSNLSGTYQSAVLARAECGRDDVRVVDSGTVSAGMELLLWEAARLRDAGADAAEIEAGVTRAKGRMRIFGVMDTLKYLVKGGRLSLARGAAGTLLSLKPVVTLRDGRVADIGKARGFRAALAFLAERIRQEGDFDPAGRVCFAHADNIEGMTALRDMLGVSADAPYCTLGAVVGTHTGPGAVVVAYLAAE